MARTLEKVTAFVVRSSSRGHDLLLFEHPSAGIQIPAGTVDPDEAPHAAVLREAREETGLTAIAIQRYLGRVDTPCPEDQALILLTTPVSTRPRVESAALARLPRGLRVRRERQADGFAQVTYEEWDQLERPTHLAYRITGWVPESALAAIERRHFFLLSAAGAPAERWVVVDGDHRFTLFWSPVTALPSVVPPQDDWLAMLPKELPSMP